MYYVMQLQITCPMCGSENTFEAPEVEEEEDEEGRLEVTPGWDDDDTLFFSCNSCGQDLEATIEKAEDGELVTEVRNIDTEQEEDEWQDVWTPEERAYQEEL